MPISVHAVTPDFVAEIGDVALDKPLAPDDLAAIRTAFTKYAILIFPDQEFDDESQLAFARNFGPLETTVFKARKDHKLRLHENMADVGNLDSENRVLAADNRQRLYNLGNRLWHTDSSFKRLPAYCSMLHARSIPPIGGQTEYADTRAAYDALDQEIASEAQRRRLNLARGGSFGFRGHRYEIVKPETGEPPFLRIALGRRGGFSCEGVIAMIGEIAKH